MKIIPLILVTVFLISCNKSNIYEFQQSLCSVDKKGFAFKAESKSKQSHRVNINNNNVYIKSTVIGKFVNDLEKSNIFVYQGSIDNGTFSYKNKSMKEPVRLGIIHYYCWRALKNKYNENLSFNEIIK